jgi:hypothetical protein
MGKTLLDLLEINSDDPMVLPRADAGNLPDSSQEFEISSSVIYIYNVSGPPDDQVHEHAAAVPA